MAPSPGRPPAVPALPPAAEGELSGAALAALGGSGGATMEPSTAAHGLRAGLRMFVGLKCSGLDQDSKDTYRFVSASTA